MTNQQNKEGVMCQNILSKRHYIRTIDVIDFRNSNNQFLVACYFPLKSEWKFIYQSWDQQGRDDYFDQLLSLDLIAVRHAPMIFPILEDIGAITIHQLGEDEHFWIGKHVFGPLQKKESKNAEWIFTSDKYPPDNTLVLFCMKDSIVHKYPFQGCYDSKTRTWTAFLSTYDDKYVSCWMAIPDIPSTITGEE